MNTKDKSKLNGKDLISIGIFTAVYFILNLLIAAAMGFIPLVIGAMIGKRIVKKHLAA